MIYGHGDDGYLSDEMIYADFSTNVLYGDDHEHLVRFLQRRIPLVLHYPEPDAASFSAAVAGVLGVSPEMVLPGNGVTELIYLIAQAYAGSRTVLFYPSFSEYEDACRVNGHQMVFLPYGEIARLPEADLVFICNPNNPSGKYVPLEEIGKIAAASPDRLVVVDESFIAFAENSGSAVSLISKYSNVCVIRSMTDEYAVPGLRLGYMAASVEVTEKVRAFVYPWHINSLAVETGKYLLERSSKVKQGIGTLLDRKDNFQAALLRIKGFEPKSSQTPFFLVKTLYSVTELKEWLVKNHGILIRNAGNFRGLNDHWFRLNTLNEKRNAVLVEALEEFSRMKRTGTGIRED